MTKPQIIVRKEGKFILDERKIMPYMRKSKDLIAVAVSVACRDLKENPDKYESLNPKDRLLKLNDFVYELLLTWGIYKSKRVQGSKHGKEI